MCLKFYVFDKFPKRAVIRTGRKDCSGLLVSMRCKWGAVSLVMDKEIHTYTDSSNGIFSISVTEARRIISSMALFLPNANCPMTVMCSG